MKIDILFQIAAVGMIVAILNLILTKSDHSEYALLITVVGLVVVLAMVAGEVGSLFETLRSVFGL
ncbi:MAG: stage III sporulation protein AC [Clostridia bacterium]|nr:stage III sporulation protein AC [Clostridia bacterium]MBQ4322710.1 stage III sporulation protein AC [Clostridia bacterium]